MSTIQDATSETVLLFAAQNDDTASALQVLQEGGIEAFKCDTLDELYNLLRGTFGAVIITEESLAESTPETFQNILAEQEFWSDLPVIFISNKDSVWATEIFSRNGNIAILERPISRLTLLRSAEVALRARRRQYRVRSILQQQKQATQARDEFFATLSHELRTPLNVMLGWLEILQDGKLDPKGQLHALDVLDRNAKVQKALIDDLLDISRIITNKMLVETSLISLGDLLRSFAYSFSPRAKQKGVTLVIKIPEGDYPVIGDEQRLGQVLSNLIVNAIKFTPSGGTVTVDFNTAGPEYVVRVRDTGQGIDPQFINSIFDRLKQEDMSITREHGGLGLGLAISSYLVNQHNGNLTASSEGRGKGATFTLKLPVPKQAEYESRARDTSPLKPNALKGARILVVDDSLDILALVKVWLTRANALVELASSAMDALVKIKEFKPDVLLSDIGMPGMDGYQLIAAVRALPFEDGGKVPAAALTAYARDEEKSLALRAGFQMHISKPISHHDLVYAVTSLVADRSRSSLT